MVSIAGESRADRQTKRAAAILGLAIGFLVFAAAAPVYSLESITIDGAAAAPEKGSCPELTRIKYPWAKCGESFALGYPLGDYGEPPESECRLYMENGMCAATTEPWNGNYQGLKPEVTPTP